MILADNYGMIPNGSGGWFDPTGMGSSPYRFTGRFDAQPDTAGPGMPPVPNPGDALIGTNQNDNAMLLAFSQAVDGFAFRISSNSLMTFDVTISEYASLDGTGTPLATSTLTSLPGGNCPGLGSVPPVPCNDAMWLVGTGFTGPKVGSIVVHTSDPSGFYLDTLFLTEPVPEPGTLGLIGLGLMGGAYMTRRRRSRS
jgi:hypothetical protein